MKLVVKLGGSLMAGDLQQWTRVLAQSEGHSHIVVPGGGTFADAVRSAQLDASGKQRFSHRSAHDMAILAMHQFGLVLAEHLPTYRLIRKVADIRAAGKQVNKDWQDRDEQQGNAIWLPDPHELATEAQIQASWDMTSDALSVWLAASARIQNVVLVKSTAPRQLNAPLPQLVASGHVDALCGQFGNRFGVRLQLLGAGEQSRLQEILAT